jgi:glycosyltransferase involved in cell wall biosynthesis
MSETPKISVVMPNFNKSNFINHAIASVTNQSFSDFELLIVDDSSTDNSVDICVEYEQRDRRVRLTETKGHRGVAAARNLGVEIARGEAICFLDSDDVYATSKLEHQYNIFNSTGSHSVVYCDWWRIDENNKLLPPGKRRHPTMSGMIFGDVLSLGFGVNVMYMVQKSDLIRVGLFDTTLPWGEEYDLLLKLARIVPFVYLDEALYGYRIHGGNTRNAIDRYSRLRYEAAIIEKHYRESQGILTPNQVKLVKRRLRDIYSKTGQYGKLIKESLGRFKT